jgi:hypothetical protein
MKPGDALTGDRWVTAVADTRCGQACYVYPDREWRWASELEPTGGAVLAVDKSALPMYTQELIRFLFTNTDMWPVEVARVTGANYDWVKEVAGKMGKRFRAENGQEGGYKRPEHLGRQPKKGR